MFGIFAVMLLTLNFLSSAVAYAGSDAGSNGEHHVLVSCDGAMGASSDGAKGFGHCHSNAQDCQAGACHFYIMTSAPTLSVVTTLHVSFSDSGDQWTISPQATPYRPPIFVL